MSSKVKGETTVDILREKDIMDFYKKTVSKYHFSNLVEFGVTLYSIQSDDYKHRNERGNVPRHLSVGFVIRDKHGDEIHEEYVIHCNDMEDSLYDKLYTKGASGGYWTIKRSYS